MPRTLTDEDCEALVKAFLTQAPRLLATWAEQIDDAAGRRTDVTSLTAGPPPVPVTVSAPSPLPRPRYVRAKELLETLWDEESRPSLRWLSYLKARRVIPFIKLGRSVFYDPEEVKTALQRFRIKARGE